MNKPSAAPGKRSKRFAVAENIYTMGVDIGSTTSKSVIMLNGNEIAGRGAVPVGAGTAVLRVAWKPFAGGEELAGGEYLLWSPPVAEEILSGRRSKINELSCHAKGSLAVPRHGQ